MLPLLGLRKSSFHLIVHSLSSCIRHRCHRRYSIIIKTRFPSFLRPLFIISFPSTDKLRLAIEIRNARHDTFFVWHPPMNKDGMTARGRRDGEVKLTPVSVCPLFLFPSLSLCLIPHTLFLVACPLSNLLFLRPPVHTVHHPCYSFSSPVPSPLVMLQRLRRHVVVTLNYCNI